MGAHPGFARFTGSTNLAEGTIAPGLHERTGTLCRARPVVPTRSEVSRLPHDGRNQSNVSALETQEFDAGNSNEQLLHRIRGRFVLKRTTWGRNASMSVYN
jgi:hypothetical protein